MMHATRAIIDLAAGCSHFVPMSVQTLGEAFRLGWRARARCLVTGPAPKSRHDRIAVFCDTVTELDMKTLVWTRGDRFPLDQLEGRLKCPRCGSRQIKIIFSVPGSPEAQSQQKRNGM